MAQTKTFNEQMLIKYPDMDKPTHCSVCRADLRYLFRIHRIGMKWYCNMCYIKYKENKNMNGLRQFLEEGDE